MKDADGYDIHGIGMDNLIPVTVYADSTGLYTEKECDADNITEMMFPACIVEEWFEQKIKCGLSPDQADYIFDQWYYEWYDADDTAGLYDFAKAYDFIGQRLDGLKREDVELGEKVYDTLFDCPWWDAPTEDDCIRMVKDHESCKKLVEHLLKVINKIEED